MFVSGEYVVILTFLNVCQEKKNLSGKQSGQIKVIKTKIEWRIEDGLQKSIRVIQFISPLPKLAKFRYFAEAYFM